MAIRDWSGRRLVGTWMAGTVAECVLIALPMAGAIALYVLAIPVGLVAITLVWLSSRISGSSPPPPRTQ